jgi:hypothetical protein
MKSHHRKTNTNSHKTIGRMHNKLNGSRTETEKDELWDRSMPLAENCNGTKLRKSRGVELE